MNWFERLARLERKNHRATIKRNVRAYRQRQDKAGIRRIEVALTAEQYGQLREYALPSEPYSATIGRLLAAISGNRESVVTCAANQ